MAMKRPLPDLGPTLPFLGASAAIPQVLFNWDIGKNCPSIYRGGLGEGAVGIQAHQILCNGVANLSKLPMWPDLVTALRTVGCNIEQDSVVGCLAGLLGLRLPTVKHVVGRMKNPTRLDNVSLQGRSVTAQRTFFVWL